MAYDLSLHLEPSSTSVLVFECQDGVIGETSLLTGLVESVRAGQMVEQLAALLDAARAAGARIFYCNAAKRADGIGNPFNTPLEMRLREKGRTGQAHAAGDVVAALAPQPGDVVVARQHGMTGFYESGLDAFLRNTGTRTVVITGVSVNVGVLGTALEAVNRGYTVVVPTDCVAGDPPEYAEQALKYSVRNVAFLTTREEIETLWKV
jgi:nicotinamidase-related amidase